MADMPRMYGAGLSDWLRSGGGSFNSNPMPVQNGWGLSQLLRTPSGSTIDPTPDPQHNWANNWLKSQGFGPPEDQQPAPVSVQRPPVKYPQYSQQWAFQQQPDMFGRVY